MTEAAPTRYRIPLGAGFQRWREGPAASEWVVYHDGTGQTLRLSEAALAILDALMAAGPLDPAGIATALADQLDAPADDAELQAALSGLIDGLLRHELIEPCAWAT